MNNSDKHSYAKDADKVCCLYHGYLVVCTMEPIRHIIVFLDEMFQQYYSNVGICVSMLSNVSVTSLFPHDVDKSIVYDDLK